MIAIDWGTTSFRAYRLDPAGRIVDSRSAPAGIFDQLGAGRHTVCLPDTHSKWVEVENGKIMHFSTHMTGEAFAVFKAHSVLGRMMKDGATNRNAFADGVRRSADAGGMLHHLFGVRSRGLFGELPDTASAPYPSGLLIGHEIHAAGVSGQPVHLLCTPNSRTSMFRHLTHWDWNPVHSIPTRSPMDCSGWRPT
jgi:2-dehydro-3-deoxygalactonokinase